MVGLINLQYAIRNEELYVLEVNPRASRTVPFVSKAIGVPLAKLASLVMVGRTLGELGFTHEIVPDHVAVKSPVFPFSRFTGVDVLLGPEMKSTGEVMGVDPQFGAAFAKATLAAGTALPQRGTVFLSVKNRDKRGIILLVKRLHDMGHSLVATAGTANVLRRIGVPATTVYRLGDPRGPNAIDLIRQGQIQLIINTPSASGPEQEDRRRIRQESVLYGVPCITTMAGAMAAVMGIEALQRGELTVRSLQEYHADLKRREIEQVAG